MINVNKKILFNGIGVLVGMAAVIYLGTSIIPKSLNTLVKASATQNVSVKNSLLIGQKIMAQADGLEKCVINVFLLDSDGKGIKGKQVQLSGLGELNATTDSLGKAVFNLTSTVPGQYELIASVNGASLKNTIKVIFK